MSDVPSAGGATPASATTRARAPASTGDLFFTFNRLALQGFGGVLAVAQRELVERKRWLTREQFVEMLSMSQVLPGPNVVNLALMFGDRFFGLRGAFAALAGMLRRAAGDRARADRRLRRVLATCAAVAGALRGMGAVAAGLVIATALKLMRRSAATGWAGRSPARSRRSPS